MTIEKLTDEDRRNIYGDLRIVARLLEMYDALAAENERLRAEAGDDERDIFTWQKSCLKAERERDAAESRLATAVGLIKRWVDGAPRLPMRTRREMDLVCSSSQFLASAQPSPRRRPGTGRA
jgi:hypothetical protein